MGHSGGCLRSNGMRSGSCGIDRARDTIWISFLFPVNRSRRPPPLLVMSGTIFEDGERCLFHSVHSILSLSYAHSAEARSAVGVRPIHDCSFIRAYRCCRYAFAKVYPPNHLDIPTLIKIMVS